MYLSYKRLIFPFTNVKHNRLAYNYKTHKHIASLQPSFVAILFFLAVFIYFSILVLGDAIQALITI